MVLWITSRKPNLTADDRMRSQTPSWSRVSFGFLFLELRGPQHPSSKPSGHKGSLDAKSDPFSEKNLTRIRIRAIA